jgi:predicted transposase/invertase (TIGR01784 family)
MKNMTKQNVAQNEKSTHKYRDSILRALCQEDSQALEIVNAITGSDYCANTKVELHDLESSLARRYNDIAISVEDELLVMIEHQSTVNPNIPFRMLSYCVDILHAWFVKMEDLNANSLHKIPTPKFYVLYNGLEPLKKDVAKLSEMFQTVASENSLELVVHVIDVNYQNNHDVLTRSSVLKGYAYLVEKIREYQGVGMMRDKAIAVAMQHCIQNDVLREFLEKNYEAVIDMFSREYDYELEKKVLLREAIEEAKFEITKKLLAKSMSIADIIEITGLNQSEINQVKFEME